MSRVHSSGRNDLPASFLRGGVFFVFRVDIVPPGGMTTTRKNRTRENHSSWRNDGFFGIKICGAGLHNRPHSFLQEE